jgi:2-iminobutanoate/2-iminopropanoate deaminase
MKTINTSNAPAPIGPYSQAILVNGFLYVSGQVAIDPKTNGFKNASVEEEANQVMDNLTAVLKEAGMDLSNVVKTTIFLTDLSDFTLVNGIYGSRFSGNFPARETVEVSRLPKDARVEISVVAYK